MESDSLPGCCALKVIYDLHCVGGKTAYDAEETEMFDSLLKERFFNCTATVCTLSREAGRAVLQRQRAFLKKKGFKLLGQWKTKGGRRTVYLYGSKEFRVPRRGKT